MVHIVRSGYRQKVVYNLAECIRKGEITRLIRYLDVEDSGALRQPHIVGHIRE
ncbi:MAG: hypothetical protein ACE5QW_03720 [Thermoplasmata archaeon]